MAQNLELKIKLDSPKIVESILKQNNVPLSETLHQEDIYYSIKKGLLKLRIEGNSYSLIKYLRDESGKNRWSNFDIIQLTGGDAEKFLSGIFTVETIVKKTRKLYWLFNTRIHIDQVERLGDFLELETIVDGNQDDAKYRFDKVIKTLNLDTDNQIRCSYRDLLLEKK
ncbi:MAG TPA: CYTH domain-containing protein [Ignavibacteria bacterium]|nr:CYTH domain-containing protein [Ignavibacteria bacterium]